jgi:hypothetical protein
MEHAHRNALILVMVTADALYRSAEFLHVCVMRDLLVFHVTGVPASTIAVKTVFVSTAPAYVTQDSRGSIVL